jgi:hypothetical protein
LIVALETALAAAKKQKNRIQEADFLNTLGCADMNVGRLKKAMALLKKQEALCIELGLRSSLGYCYWNWRLLARKFKDKNTKLKKLQADLKIIGFPAG